MIKIENNVFEIPGSWSFRARSAPDRKYVPASRSWRLPNHRANRHYLLSAFKPENFSPAALQACTVAAAAEQSATRLKFPYEPEGILPHQMEALNLAYGVDQFAFFHEMGSGKSRTQLELWKAWLDNNIVDECWMIAPNSLLENFEEQVAKWAPSHKEAIKAYGVLSLSQGSLSGRLVRASHSKLAVGIDESQRIKNSRANRTGVMYEIGKNCRKRNIMTGTEITKGIEDLYAQYAFLDPAIIGYTSYYSFRNRYCKMGGFENKQIIGYQNQDELTEALKPHTHVVVNPIDLPPMTPEKRVIKPTAEQKQLIRELKNQMEVEMAGNKLSIDNVLTYMTRGAQILGGFFPTDDKRIIQLPNNPLLEELESFVESTSHKIVVFCRFIAETNMVEAALNKARPGSCVRLGSDRSDNKELEAKFMTGSAQVLVCTYAFGALGFTWTAGRVVLKYSPTNMYEFHAQAPRRIRRLGQEHATIDVDFIVDHPLSRAMVQNNVNKQDMADWVKGVLSSPKRFLELF